MAEPRIAVGVAGTPPTLTASVCGPELPQAPFAVTDTVPALVPIADMIVLVVEVPVQPFGRVHVYDVAPLTAATEKVSGLPALQPADLLMIAAGVAGAVFTTTASVCAGELIQPLEAFTVTLPLLVPAVAMIVSVVEVPVQPFGSVQIYEVAPLTGATMKVSKMPLHKVSVPLMAPGVGGAAAMVTTSVCAEEVPHLLPAVTETVPPADPAVAMIVSVVEVPVQPLGSDQV